ncbi:Uncharacterised protein [Bordetella pertussis]|nr:Uncharacterised protein [Bordetella pertussis]CPM13208.1 Uncharacterised protein [Bordetella pertussis]
MPAVTVESRPNGEPMASTHCPFFSVLGSPMVSGVMSLASILIRATSVRSSEPITLALNSRPSVRVT